MKYLLVLVAMWFGVIPADLLAQPRRQAGDSVLHLVFTSDAHFGLTRAHFRGSDSVSAQTVNQALVAAINQLPAIVLPADGGLGAGRLIGSVEAVIEGGDVANRAEGGVQRASASWAQFLATYQQGLRTTDHVGAPTQLWPVVGNHDASNAIGFYRSMTPSTDPTAWVGIYNLTMQPTVPLTVERFNPSRDRVHYSRDVAGVHLMFLHIWPDSSERAWMARDLSRVPPSTPVLLFTHDQPDAEAKHFQNPNGVGDINAHDKFENLLAERLGTGMTVESPTIPQQRAFAEFLRRTPNIRGYFHGNSNAHEFYDWPGPDGTLRLPVFRVDSPMKGAKSASDERLLSFLVISISADGSRLTARECRYNAAGGGVRWGEARSIALH